MVPLLYNLKAHSVVPTHLVLCFASKDGGKCRKSKQHTESERPTEGAVQSHLLCSLVLEGSLP